MKPRVRFAPSPTGALHVGGARTALFNWLFARHQDGTFLLRSEDTDQARSSAESERRILADLRWLGIDWDEGPDVGGPRGPYRQSERLEIYRDHARRLIESGAAYEAWETSEELDALRRAAGEGFRYRRRPYSAGELERYRAEGRTPVVRLAVTEGEALRFEDLILGPVEIESTEVDDVVLIKADGFPTYHFGVVVDDHGMEITHVLRAQEHLRNTFRHLLLYRAFGWEPPLHGHMPLIFSMDGGKMSKRDKAKASRAAARGASLSASDLAARAAISEASADAFLAGDSDDVDIATKIGSALGVELPEIDVVDFRRAGYLPEALVNFLALQGWNPGDEREIFTRDELVAAFSLERMGKTAAKFDRAKLRWMNGAYIRELPIERLEARLGDFAREAGHPVAAWDGARRGALAVLYRERAETLGDLIGAAGFFFTAPTAWGPDAAIDKHLRKNDGFRLLRVATEALGGLETWTAETIEGALHSAAEREAGGKLGKIAQPVRIGVSGGPVSPPIGGTLALLGRDESLARLRACAAHFGEGS